MKSTRMMKKKDKISAVTFLIPALLILFFSGCKKTEEKIIALETGTVTDIDNNVYKTVHIGNQWWMAEDLKTVHYRSGYTIANHTDSIEWISDTTGGYSDLTNDQHIVIGKLYNWHAINNSNLIAPAGWHIPSDDEWKTLEKYLGMSQEEADKMAWRGTHEGEKLKVEAPLGWSSYESVWGTNESGFTALARGCRLFNGSWGAPGLFSTGFWWSSTTHGDTDAWYRYLDYKNANVFRSHCPKNYGYSVRCVKD